jgi:hypothetical protein
MERQGRRGRRWFLVALGAALATLGIAALPAGGAGWHLVASSRLGYSLRLPDGWHRSRRRLVPLLMPREVLSVGNFAMAPGGGGECDREPAASTRRMRSGDVLITLQEYRVTAKLRARLTHNFPPLPPRLELDGLSRSPGAGSGGRPRVLYTRVSFSQDGRAFDALLYFGGQPTVARRRTAASILAGIRLGPHA